MGGTTVNRCCEARAGAGRNFDGRDEEVAEMVDRVGDASVGEMSVGE